MISIIYISIHDLIDYYWFRGIWYYLFWCYRAILWASSRSVILSSISILLMSLFLSILFTSVSVHFSLTPPPAPQAGSSPVWREDNRAFPLLRGRTTRLCEVEVSRAYETSGAPRCSFTARIAWKLSLCQGSLSFRTLRRKIWGSEVRHHVLLCQRRILRF